MSTATSIEWTRGDDGSAGATWNPVTGCTKVSPGCDHCYAETFAERWRGVPEHPYAQGFDLRLWPERLQLPLRWRKPRRVFVNSMSDLFHDGVDAAFIQRVFAVMWASPQHTYQVLTKRPGRMASLLGSSGWWLGTLAALDELLVGLPGLRDAADAAAFAARVDRRRRERPDGWCALGNVWLGTSIELDKYVWRADRLRATPAAIRFVSLEPLLGALPSLDLAGLDWIIVGGESGPGARPMHPQWARKLRDRCVELRRPLFFKQVGAWAPLGADAAPRAGDRWVELDGRHDRRWRRGDPLPDAAQTDGAVLMRRVGKHRAGRLLDGRTWDQFPAKASP